MTSKPVYLRVVVYDENYYAMTMLGRCLAWDRRTHVRKTCDTLPALWDYLHSLPPIERPDVLVISAEMTSPLPPVQTLRELHTFHPQCRIICVSQSANVELVQQCVEGGANAFFLKHEVRFSLSWAVIFSLAHRLVVTPEVARSCALAARNPVFYAVVLPKYREYPELTERVREAMCLHVIFGLPAHLIAQQMYLSINTVRSYIKEGYRILESYNDNAIGWPLSPRERAIMYFTALESEDE